MDYMSAKDAANMEEAMELAEQKHNNGEFILSPENLVAKQMSHSWLVDVLNCINSIDKVQFTLSEVYAFKDELKRQHPDNNNVEAKIRQQLQVLRDKGILEFVDRGVYRKI